jgi:two-component system response regulator RegA
MREPAVIREEGATSAHRTRNRNGHAVQVQAVEPDRIVGDGVLVIDSEEAFGVSLGRSFAHLGYSTWLIDDLEQAVMICEQLTSALVVTELQIGGKSVFDFLDRLPLRRSRWHVVIATVYPSIVMAQQAIRLGFDGYVVKPVNAAMILATVATSAANDPNETGAWPSLDRTIWEYVNQVFHASGNVSEAARRLGLDRRSLRRMLAKDPPSR